MKRFLMTIMFGFYFIGCSTDVIIDTKVSKLSYHKLTIKFDKIELDSNKNILVYSALPDGTVYSISTENMKYVIK